MSRTPLPTHPTRTHPHTGLALQAVGFRRSGDPIWPILGAAPDDPPADPPANDPSAPERPDGVTEEEWNALGDPGRAAIVREREARQAAERALAAARARPTPPKPPADPPQPNDPPKPADPPKPSDPPDIAAIVQQAVEAAVKPFVEREEQRETQAAAEKVTQSVLDVAKDRLHDATDALSNIDLTTVVNEQGAADADKIKTALDELITRKPHLAKSTVRIAPPGIGGGGPAGATDAEKVKAVLADMQKATGVRMTDPKN
jgi:hypothetical protein